jgi:replicative DNA helicase
VGAVDQPAPPEHRRTYQASVRDALGEVDEQLRTRTAMDVRTVPTGWDVLDEILAGGLHAGELLLLGGPPGVGKTVAGLQWARNIARAGHRAVFICYEHSPTTLLTRLLTLEAGEAGSGQPVSRALSEALGSSDAQGRSLEETLADTNGGPEALARVGAYADDLVLVRASGAHTTLEDVSKIVSQHVTPARRTVVFVDYLQKIPLHPEPEMEAEKVTRTVEGLKDLALEFHVPVVAISAVDRSGMEGGRIRMHHLRGSSAAAFESDVVLMLNDKHRAVSKVHLSYDARAERTFREWVVFSIEKNRGGPALLDLEFHKDFSHYRFHPDGGLVSERLVDERLDEHDL